jgi:hypothetical protein
MEVRDRKIEIFFPRFGLGRFETRTFPPFCFFFVTLCTPLFVSLPLLLLSYHITLLISGKWRHAAHAGWGIASRATWAAHRGFSNGHLLCRVEDVSADSGAHVNVVWLVACGKLWRSGELRVSFRIQINAILQVGFTSWETLWGIRDHEKIKPNAALEWIPLLHISKVSCSIFILERDTRIPDRMFACFSPPPPKQSLIYVWVTTVHFHVVPSSSQSLNRRCYMHVAEKRN